MILMDPIAVPDVLLEVLFRFHIVEQCPRGPLIKLACMRGPETNKAHLVLRSTEPT